MTETENEGTTRVQIEPREDQAPEPAKGTPVQHHASLHEKAVQAIADGTVKIGALKTRKPPERRSTPLDYHIAITHPMLKAEVERIVSEGKYTKVKIVDEETVIIR